jgi:hypothetical protein
MYLSNFSLYQNIHYLLETYTNIGDKRQWQKLAFVSFSQRKVSFFSFKCGWEKSESLSSAASSSSVWWAVIEVGDEATNGRRNTKVLEAKPDQKTLQVTSPTWKTFKIEPRPPWWIASYEHPESLHGLCDEQEDSWQTAQRKVIFQIRSSDGCCSVRNVPTLLRIRCWLSHVFRRNFGKFAPDSMMSHPEEQHDLH